MTDWVRWHDEYADPDSSLSRRRVVVQRFLRRVLDSAASDGEVRLISMCAGDGRDVLPVLASHPRGGRVRAVLVELDPELSGRARAAAGPGVEVRTADAGLAESYRGLAPAHVVLACGVFGNISAADVETTVAALPALLMPGGHVIWTRGRGAGDVDPSQGVRDVFDRHGFEELAFVAPQDARFRVGLSRLVLPPRLFRFA
ncbi:class I SAM-dependent methyltransferase [Actinoplanes sp. RD1]|uniref:SAM-dependent methyltransferase n=1 Tax=Actinoplanes sp. RD1 TaxID=3064538 RepID=UPI0027428A8B|nr:SAM-dependent methyltransferase [Actinoplanes sp. RD1]